MQFRNELSKDKKFTSTPEDFNDLIRSTLLEGLDQDIEGDNKELKVSGRIYPNELILKISLTQNGVLKCHNFSGSIDHDTDSADLIDRAQELMEALSSMMLEFIEEEGEIDMPLDWHEYEFGDRNIYLKYSTENDSIESRAAALLGEEDPMRDDSEDSEYVGMDFFKEAEEKFKGNLH